MRRITWLIMLLTLIGMFAIPAASALADDDGEGHGRDNAMSRGDRDEDSGNRDHKVAICHATGSDDNAFVMISVDEHALDTHLDQGDVLPSASVCPGPTLVAGVSDEDQDDVQGLLQ